MRIFFKKIFRSFRNAFKGFKIQLKQFNFRLMILIAFLAIILGLLLKISYFEWLILLVIISLILALETFNTTIEMVLDYLEPNFSNKIGMIKDLAASGVVIAVFASLIIGFLIFFPKIISLLKYGL